MEKNIVEQMIELSKSSMDYMMKLQEINDRTVQTLAKKQMDTVSSYMQNGMKRMKIASETKDVQGAIASQTDLASELGQLMIVHAKETMDILNASKKDLSDLMEENLRKLMENVKPGSRG